MSLEEVLTAYSKAVLELDEAIKAAKAARLFLQDSEANLRTLEEAVNAANNRMFRCREAFEKSIKDDK